MRKSKAFEAGLKAVREMKPDRFVVKIKRPSEMTHKELAERIYWKIHEVDALQDIEIK